MTTSHMVHVDAPTKSTREHPAYSISGAVEAMGRIASEMRGDKPPAHESAASGLAREIHSDCLRAGWKARNPRVPSIAIPWGCVIPTDGTAPAGDERESSVDLARAEIEARLGQTEQRATYQTGTAAAGGQLVGAQRLAVDNIRPESVIYQSGCTVLSGLVSDMELTRPASKTSVTWLASETTAIGQSEATLANPITMTPHDVGAFSRASRRTQTVASLFNDWLDREIRAAVAEALDRGVIRGSGSGGQPTGILNTTGIGSVTNPASGNNGGDLTLDHLVALESDVADGCQTDNVAYLANGATIAKIKRLMNADNLQQLWREVNGRGRRQRVFVANGGIPVYRSGQLPSGGSRGSSRNLSKMICIAPEHVIVGLWGPGIELASTSSMQSDFATGTTAFRVLLSMDVALRHAAAASKIENLITA